MAKLAVDKIQGLIDHIKQNSSKLASEGVDQTALAKQIAALEAELKKPQPDHSALQDLLALIEMTIEEAEETLATTGVIRFLNTIFGTGVPSP